MAIVALEGIDKSGKGTQAGILLDRLRNRGYEAEKITFPDYRTPLGREIKRFLNGYVDLCPEARQLLYVANRWERKRDIDTWLREGKIIVADRYIPSGLVYGLANNLNFDWILKLEEGLPTADIVIVIDISVDTAFGRRRGERNDIYEKNKQFLERVRVAYLNLADRLNWKIVDGEKSIEEVYKQIWKCLEDAQSPTKKILEDLKTRSAKE